MVALLRFLEFHDLAVHFTPDDWEERKSWISAL